MRPSRLSLLAVVVTVAACSGDTFQPSAAPPGAGAGTGGTAGSEAAGTGGATGDAGTSAGEGGSAGEGPTAGAAGTGSDPAGTGGTSTSGGSAGNSGGAAGSNVVPAGGAAGAAGKSGNAGAAGTGTGGCGPQLPNGPPPTASCGNGVVEANETCDDGTKIDNDGCSASCQLECNGSGVLVDGHCYTLLDANVRAEQIYDGPTEANQAQDLVRPRWGADPCAATGVATHMLVLETALEQAHLQASSGFLDLIAPKIALIGAYVGAGARFRTDLALTKPEAWRNGEGGQFPGVWKASSPGAAGGRCMVINKAGTFDNVQCFLPGGTPSATRSVLCEREQACAITDAEGTAHVGYLGPNNHCYVRFPTANDAAVSRPEAEATCAAGGAHLVTFESLAELTNLTGTNLTSGGVWVGARKLACNADAFTWETTGVPLNLGGAFWSDGQPNLNTGACVTMSRNRRLTVTPCDSQAAVLCER